jgi:hypothetical protein
MVDPDIVEAHTEVSADPCRDLTVDRRAAALGVHGDRRRVVHVGLIGAGPPGQRRAQRGISVGDPGASSSGCACGRRVLGLDATSTGRRAAGIGVGATHRGLARLALRVCVRCARPTKQRLDRRGLRSVPAHTGRAGCPRRRRLRTRFHGPDAACGSGRTMRNTELARSGCGLDQRTLADAGSLVGRPPARAVTSSLECTPRCSHTLS